MGASKTIIHYVYNTFMKNMKKWTLHILLGFTLLFGFLFVRNVLNEKEIKVVEKTEQEDIEIHPAKVTLQVVAENQTTASYKETLETDDTVGDLFERLRKDTNFTYEKVAFTYGVEVDSINGLKSTSGNKWALYVQASEGDPLEKIDLETLLKNKAVYYLKYESE